MCRPLCNRAERCNIIERAPSYAVIIIYILVQKKTVVETPFLFFPPPFYLCNKVDVGRVCGQLQYFVIIAEGGWKKKMRNVSNWGHYEQKMEKKNNKEIWQEIINKASKVGVQSRRKKRGKKGKFKGGGLRDVNAFSYTRLNSSPAGQREQ